MEKPYPRWLETAIIYEIYPQSFMDSNGDGIGDIQGIVSRLDYIRGLGVNTIWLNPIYDSPFRDAGYDVRDYLSIAPRYGTMDDLRSLVKTARERGIRIILDFIPGHTSDEHPWFRQSSRHERNRYSDRYVWTKETFDWTPGTERFVNGLFPRNGGYLPNFFPFQPALNYGYAHPRAPWQLATNHPAVLELREEMISIMRFYLELGVSGFRVDMAHSLVKEDTDFRETRKLWRDIRSRLENQFPDMAMVSEWSCPRQSIATGFHVDFYIHFGVAGYNAMLRNEMAHDANPPRVSSWFDARGRGEPRTFAREFTEHLLETRDRGFISVPSGNHDMFRVSDGRSDEDLKLVFAFLLTLPGIPQLYYGDELGMRNLKGLPSKEGGYARTQARTPMPWDDGPNAGFSAAAAADLYLPIGEENFGRNARAAERDPSSLLSFVREMIALRASRPALGNTAFFQPFVPREGSYPFAYARTSDDEALLVVLNPADNPRGGDFDIPLFTGTRGLVSGTEGLIERRGGAVRIEAPARSYGIYELQRG